MNWKKVMVTGLVMVAAAVAVDMLWGTVSPSQAAIIATQQGDDTTAAHVATRAVSESVGMFGLVCDGVKYAGYFLILAGVILYFYKVTETKPDLKEAEQKQVVNEDKKEAEKGGAPACESPKPVDGTEPKNETK